jgi:hypothetical protein
MNLCAVADRQRCRGLHIYDFGERVALGCTADEMGVLLESGFFWEPCNR